MTWSELDRLSYFGRLLEAKGIIADGSHVQEHFDHAHQAWKIWFDAHPDDHPGEGPLGGICTALRLAPADIVVVLSCDMPSIDAATVSALVASLADQPGADVAAPVVDGHVQAITAAYRRSARPGLVGAFEQGERAVRRALAGLSVQAIEGLDAHRLADVDRPEDLPRYARPS